MAELEVLYGAKATSWLQNDIALIDVKSFDFNRLGGSQKAGKVIADINHHDWQRVSKAIIDHYVDRWKNSEHKITLGIGAYGFSVSPRDVQKTGIILKKQLKTCGVSLRLIPNQTEAHNTAVSHHNKLGLSPNKIELLVIKTKQGAILAESVGAQNISAFAARDQARPKTDAFVGMLPPKLARMMINMTPSTKKQHLLDPFCGTGVVLQEAALMGLIPYGSDLSEKMVDYSKENLVWLADKHQLTTDAWRIELGDAMNHTWQRPINLVVAESYLGQPFSAPPHPDKLHEVKRNCNHIITEFLKNIAPQIEDGTPLTLAVPAWRSASGQFTNLPLINSLSSLGYKQRELSNVATQKLLYYREGQVVARHLLLIERA